MDKNTPPNQKHLLEMSLATRKETVEACLDISRGELKGYAIKYGYLECKAVEHRAKTGFVNERPHYLAWHRELIKYRNFKIQLAGIVAELEKKTGENYHSMFVRTAKTELSRDIFHHIRERAVSNLDEFYATV